MLSKQFDSIFLLIVERIVGVCGELKTIHIDQNIKRKAVKELGLATPSRAGTHLIFNEQKLTIYREAFLGRAGSAIINIRDLDNYNQDL